MTLVSIETESIGLMAALSRMEAAQTAAIHTIVLVLCVMLAVLVFQAVTSK